MRNWNGQLNVAHSLATHTRQRDFDAAAIADNAFMFDAFVFSAGAFPIARWSENTFAEKSAFLRFERSIIDRLGIFDFAFAPRPHRVARSHANCDLIETDRSLFTN